MADDLVIRIVADDSEITNSMQNLISQTNELSDNVDQTGEAIQNSFDPDPIDDVNDTVEDLNEEIDTLNSRLEELSKNSKKSGVNTRALGNSIGILGRGFNGVRSGVIRLGRAFKALAANPIFLAITLLVGAVVGLFKAFTSTKEGAEALSRVSAGFSAIIRVIRDLALKAGEALIDAFSNPVESLKSLGQAIVTNIVNRFKGIILLAQAVGGAISAAFSFDAEELAKSADDAKDALVQIGTGLDEEQQKRVAQSVKEVANEISNEASQAVKLKKALQEVNDTQRDLSVSRAKLNTQLVKARAIADDANKPIAERLDALNKVIEAEQRQLNAEIRAQTKKIKALKALAAQTDKNAVSEKELQEIAQEEIKLANLRTQSESKLIEIQNKRRTLQKQVVSEQKEAAQLELEIKNLLVDKEEELAILEAKNQKALRDQAIKDAFEDGKKREELLKISEQALQNAITKIQEEAQKERDEKAKIAQDKKFQEKLAELNTEIELEKIKKEKEREQDRQTFFAVARSEEEITKFKKDQDKAKKV